MSQCLACLSRTQIRCFILIGDVVSPVTSPVQLSLAISVPKVCESISIVSLVLIFEAWLFNRLHVVK